MTLKSLNEAGRKVYQSTYQPTAGGTFSGYGAVPTLTTPSPIRFPNDMALSGDSKGVIAPVAGVMTISGFNRFTAIGSGVQASVQVNDVAVGETFAYPNSHGTECPLPTFSVRVNAGDKVGVGYGGNGSNTYSAANQSSWYFVLIASN